MSELLSRESDLYDEQEQIQALFKPSKQKQRASIDALRDAVTPDGRFIPSVGEHVIVELSTPRGFWLYTTEFLVQSVRDDGSVGLYDERDKRCAGVNYRHKDPCIRLKLPNSR